MKNRDSLVSVIIPTYNRANVVQKAVDSVLDQTYKNTEIIIVDDGSTDNTKQALLPYGSRIKYLNKKQGVSSARNLGIKKAAGEYMAFLDSDDEWYPEKLEKQLKYFEKNPNHGMVYTSYEQISNDVRQLCYSSAQSVEGNLFNEILRSFGINLFIATPSIMIRKEVFFDIGYYNENLITGEDIELYLRIARKYSIGYVRDVLVKVRKCADNITKIAYPESGIVNALKNICDIYPEFKNSSDMKNALARHYMRKGKELFNWDMKEHAASFFINALKFNPYNIGAFLYLFASYWPNNTINSARKIKRILKI